MMPTAPAGWRAWAKNWRARLLPAIPPCSPVLGEELASTVATGDTAVLACSALKRRYRDTLRAAAPDVGFVYLALTPTEAAERVSHRPGHFMPATLIESQFRDLETPTGEPRVLTVNATDPWPSIVDAVLAWWR